FLFVETLRELYGTGPAPSSERSDDETTVFDPEDVKTAYRALTREQGKPDILIADVASRSAPSSAR
ncbi:MAG: hypothetical protein HC923_07055, partial [Myxococcales bacterium]|nr:hypothetical protein [Myxococcales bacterium]